jgi:hypothetical protein
MSSPKRALPAVAALAAAIMLAGAGSPAPPNSDDAAALFSRGEFAAAAAAYDKAFRANPADRSAMLGLATIRVYENDLNAAEPLLDSLLYAEPQNMRASELLGEVQRRRAETARRTTLEVAQAIVPFLTADPLPVVRVVANGRPANFIVDTGADVVLEPSFAKQIGVKTAPSGNGVFAGGLRAPTEKGMVASLSLGAATAHDVPVHVLPTHATELFRKLPIDGIVGTTYFERYLVTIDYPNDRLVLRSRSPEVSAAFQAKARSDGAAIVPFYLVGDHFVIAPAQVNDASGLFVFDSGLAGGGLMPSRQLLAAAGISLHEAAAHTGYGGGGAVTAIPFIAQRVAVGSAVQHNVRGLYTPQGSPFGIFPFTLWGAISNDFLAHYAYTVDFDAMKLVME